MLKPVYRTSSFLCQLVSCLPIGTSLGIAHLLWTILSGQLLQSRGAVFPALSGAGLCPTEVRQSEASLREGKWKISTLLKRLRWMIALEHLSEPIQIGGWRPLLIDWVGFFRPHLRDCASKHYASEAGKALPAIALGMVARVQTVKVHPDPNEGEGRRIPQLVALNRTGETTALLCLAKAEQKSSDVLVADRQVKVSHVEEAQLEHFVIRGQQNLSARRSEPPAPVAGKRGKRPTRGVIVRPTARHYRSKVLPATPPDREESFLHEGRLLRAQWFDHIIVTGSTRIVSCLVIVDPRYKQPWVLVTDIVGASAETVYLLYRSRWTIEQLPQTGKQILGGHRAFVHADQSRYRLPELCLLAASLSQYLSATCEAVASGFWDRRPKRTPGRFRRVLSEANGHKLPEFRELPSGKGRVREKRAIHDHLTKGIIAHRRQPAMKNTPALTGK